jgi:hypothetical protein
MTKLTEKQAVAISLLAAKLREKTSVVGYVVMILGVFGVNKPDLAEQIGGAFALAGSLVLILFNDKTVHSWIISDAPPPVEAMEPDPVTISPTAVDAAPEEGNPMSFASVASSLLAKLQAVAALMPLLTSLVQTVEAALPAGTPGATKLDAVKNAIQSVYEKEQLATASFSEVWPLLSGVVDTLVATFKATGAFTSASSSNAAAPKG